MSNYLFESGITRLSERIDIVTDKNDQFRNYIDHTSRKVNLESNISWVLAKMTFAFEFSEDNSLAKFKDFLKEFNEKNKSKIEFDTISDKHWIRTVFDSIELPNQIRRSFRKFEKKERIDLSEDDLKILNLLYQFKKNSNPPELKTSKDKLLTILTQQELELLIDREVLAPLTNDSFSVKNNDYFNYLKNEICSSLWILLSDKIQDDKYRLITYVNTIIRFGINWPDRLSDFFDYRELKELQSSALKVLLDEKDLENEGFEFNKIWLDSPLYSHIEINQETPKFKITGSNPFDLLSNIADLKRKHHWLYEEADSVRLKYGLLLNIVLQTVKYNQHDKGNIQVLFDLVAAVKRPYLVYHSCWIMKKYYQFLLPYLLLEIKTASLPFILLNEIEIKENATSKNASDLKFENKKDNELRTEFFKSMFDLLLDKIAENQHNFDESTEILFQLFKFQVNSFYHNTSYTNQTNHVEEKIRFEYLIKSFSEIRSTGHFAGVSRPRIFPKYLNDFIERLLEDHLITESNKYLGFNCAKFELIYQFLLLSWGNFTENELSPEEKATLEINTNKLITNWKELYLDYFTKDEVEILNAETNENEIQKIRRNSDPSGIEILNWGHFWAFINESGLLEEILKTINSSISIDNTETQDYSDINLESKAKLKFFMKSVALGLISLKRDKAQFSYLFNNIDSLLNELELTLQNYTIQHCITDLKRQRIFVFDEMASTLNNDIYYEPTIKLVFIALNLNDNSSLVKFHKSLLENKLDLLFLLTILNLSESEEVIELITERIENIDSIQFIDNVKHVDQWKDAIIESLNSSTHFEIASPIISKLENWLSKVSIPDDRYSKFIFRTKLMLAFKRKNIAEINQTEQPKQNIISASQRNPFEDLRNYFKALHWGYNENEYEKALIIFKDLFFKNQTDTNSRYHIFHLETLNSIATENSEELLKIKYDWDQFVEEASKEERDKLKSIQSNINYTLLFHYCHFGDFESTDRIIQSLPEILKFDEKIIEFVFQSYQQRELALNAMSYLSSVEKYYGDRNSQVQEMVHNLRETIDDTKRISELSVAYNQIYSLPFKELPRVVPKSLNGRSNIQEFIFQEIIQASFILLEKINSISQITWENKYNDLLLTALRLRFAVWNWVITDQPRAGESKSGGGDLGSLDFVISSAGKSIALIEAMILESGNMAKTEEHITKCFTYLSQSKVHYIVVYFKGPKDNFESSWSSYKTNVLTLDYQDDQKLRKKEFKDTSQELEKNTIKVGITHHVNGVNIYHIYLKIPSIENSKSNE